MTSTNPEAAAPPERFNVLRLEAPERFQTVGRLYNRDGLAVWWVTESEGQVPEWFSQRADDLLCVVRARRAAPRLRRRQAGHRPGHGRLLRPTGGHMRQSVPARIEPGRAGHFRRRPPRLRTTTRRAGDALAAEAMPPAPGVLSAGVATVKPGAIRRALPSTGLKARRAARPARLSRADRRAPTCRR